MVLESWKTEVEHCKYMTEMTKLKRLGNRTGHTNGSESGERDSHAWAILI